MMGFPVLVIEISDMCRLRGALLTVPLLARTAVRRPFILDGLQDFCIVAVVLKIN
jgi:hypothetical protein